MMQYKNYWLLLSCLLVSFSDSLVAKEHTDTPPVQELRSLLDSDPKFQRQLTLALANVKKLADGSENPWKGKSDQQLFEFLNDWYYFLPDASNGLDKIMEFSLLYRNNPAGLAFINGEPGRGWSLRFVELRGKYLDSLASQKGVRKWLNDKSVDNSAFIEPEGGYQSFNQYFVRELRPGARPISESEDANVVVSPADCIINHLANHLTADTSLKMKGRMALNINQILDGSKYAKYFVGGSAYSCFLMPQNYHHYHSPVSGTVVESNQSVGARLFGLNDLVGMASDGNPGHNKDFSVFEDFKHGYFVIKTDSLGYVAMVPVGLQTVGSVIFEEPFKRVNQGGAQPVAKGQKLGHFAYGGSTVLLFFEKNRFNALSVKQGQRIGEGH